MKLHYPITILGLGLWLSVAAFGQQREFHLFTANLSPSAENPPVTTSRAYGAAQIVIYLTRNQNGDPTEATVDFQIRIHAEQQERLVNMHIHSGAVGVNGPVVIGSNFGPAIDLPAGMELKFMRQVVISDLPTLQVVESIIQNPSAYYVNIHAASNPAGLVRGNLQPADLTAIQMLQMKADSLSVLLRDTAQTINALIPLIVRMAVRQGIVAPGTNPVPSIPIP